jgi:DNA-binding transcriptional ArsR family regulator
MAAGLLPEPRLEDIELDAVFGALADPNRLRVVVELARGGDEQRSCASFALPVAKSTRTHHWRVLREAGLIHQRDAGNGNYVSLRREELERRFPGLLQTLKTIT